MCKIENKSHFIREKFLIFGLVFEKIMIFLFFEGYFFGNFQKNRSQKSSMLKEKQGQFWNLHRIPNKTSNFIYSSIPNKTSYPDFQFFKIPHQKNKTKIKNRDSRILMQIPKLTLFFF